MKKILVAMGIILLAGCSKNTQYTQDLTGSWYVYKLTLFNIQQQFYADTILNDSVTFTSNGQYTKLNIIKTVASTYDTVYSTGKWKFQDSYGQLVLSDTANVPQDTFTVLNLTGNSVELLSYGFDRYMRKKQ